MSKNNISLNDISKDNIRLTVKLNEYQRRIKQLQEDIEQGNKNFKTFVEQRNKLLLDYKQLQEKIKNINILDLIVFNYEIANYSGNEDEDDLVNVYETENNWNKMLQSLLGEKQ